MIFVEKDGLRFIFFNIVTLTVSNNGTNTPKASFYLPFSVNLLTIKKKAIFDLNGT